MSEDLPQEAIRPLLLHSGSNYLIRIMASNAVVVATIETGSAPWGLAFDGANIEDGGSFCHTFLYKKDEALS